MATLSTMDYGANSSNNVPFDVLYEWGEQVCAKLLLEPIVPMDLTYRVLFVAGKGPILGGARGKKPTKRSHVCG